MTGWQLRRAICSSNFISEFNNNITDSNINLLPVATLFHDNIFTVPDNILHTSADRVNNNNSNSNTINFNVIIRSVKFKFARQSVTGNLILTLRATGNWRDRRRQVGVVRQRAVGKTRVHDDGTDGRPSPGDADDVSPDVHDDNVAVKRAQRTWWSSGTKCFTTFLLWLLAFLFGIEDPLAP